MDGNIRDRMEEALKGQDARYIEVRVAEVSGTHIWYRGKELDEIGHTAGQSNILGGDFNANVLLGYRIDGGKVTGRVKNTVISGNVYTALKDIEAVERESHWVGGSLKTPAISVGGISVATKE